MLLAVLNCPAAEGSAWLAGRFLRESFLRGGRACRTMVASPSLDAVFVDPALAWLKLRGVAPRFGARLRALGFDGDRVVALDYGQGMEAIHDAAVVLAVPPWVASELVPGLAVPDRFCAIVNAHFAYIPPPGAPAITALLGATAQWVVCHHDRISVTISGADDLVDADREAFGPHALERDLRDAGHLRGIAALADRQGKARDIRWHPRTGRAAAGSADALAQPFPRRRLGADRAPRNDRRRLALRPQRRKLGLGPLAGL